MAIPNSGKHIYTNPTNQTQLRSALFAAALGDVDLQTQITTLDAGVVKATATFAVDNRIIISDGTGRNVAASVATISDAGALSGVVSIEGGVVINDLGADADFVVEGDTASNLFRCNAGTDSVNIGTTVEGDLATIGPNGTVFNTNGADRDFRVEGDTVDALLFVDASAERVALGGPASAPANVFYVQAGVGTVINEAGAADIDFRVEGSSGYTHLFFVDASDLSVSMGTPSTPGRIAYFHAGGIVFNEVGADQDFRVEGDTMTHMFWCDASAATENIALLGTTAINWQSMDRGLFIGDTSTAPTGNPASGAFVYVSGGELRTRSSAGDTYTLTGYAVGGYGVGSFYTATTSYAEVDRGTTDSAVTLAQAGTYKLSGKVLLNFNSAQFAGVTSFSLKLRRTNNTAADVTNSEITFNMPWAAQVDGAYEFTVPPVVYTTANTTDRIALFVQLGGSPSSGSVSISGDSVFAERLY